MTDQNDLPYAGSKSKQELAALSAEQFSLTIGAVARPASWKSIEWSPKDSSVHDLEIRARITGATGTLGAFTRVLWKASLGAGEFNFAEPISSLQQGGGTVVVPYWMADRGMVLRVNARRVKLAFRAELVSGVATQLEMAASIQPAGAGSSPPQFPVASAGLAAARCAVPMSANEWRFRDPATGAAFAAGSVTGFSALSGLVGPILLAALADFTPISPFVASYVASVSHLVEFR